MRVQIIEIKNISQIVLYLKIWITVSRWFNFHTSEKNYGFYWKMYLIELMILSMKYDGEFDLDSTCQGQTGINCLNVNFMVISTIA